MTIAFREKGKTWNRAVDCRERGHLAGTRLRDAGDRRVRSCLCARAQWPEVTGASPEEMAAALAMYPMLKTASADARRGGQPRHGHPHDHDRRFGESEEQMAAEEVRRGREPSHRFGGVGGLVGGWPAALPGAARKPRRARRSDDHHRDPEGDDRRGPLRMWPCQRASRRAVDERRLPAP